MKRYDRLSIRIATIVLVFCMWKWVWWWYIKAITECPTTSKSQEYQQLAGQISDLSQDVSVLLQLSEISPWQSRDAK